MSQKTEIQNSATETNAKLGVVINCSNEVRPCRLVVTAVDGGICFCHLLDILRSLQIFTNLRGVISQKT
jgi:hypothetical protein